MDQAARLELYNFLYSRNYVPKSGSAHFEFLKAPGTPVHNSFSGIC